VLLAVLLAATAGVAACGSSSKPASAPASSTTRSSPASTVAPVIDPGDGGNYHPRIDPADFVAVIDNPYMPFTPGSKWRYEGMSDGVREINEVTVTDRHQRVLGIDAVVVHDVVESGGAVTEDTIDWYAQDKEGNVWYLGEQSKEFAPGEPVSTAGSWEAGVDGALPGIVMPAVPRTGDAYRQEYYAGEAEDLMKVIATDHRATVEAGSYTSVVVTEEWNPLEPKVIENKSYARGVGMVLEEGVRGASGRSELVEYTPGR
jgi:hypothetical protein